MSVRMEKYFSKFVWANRLPFVFNENKIKKAQRVRSTNLRLTFFAFNESIQIKNRFKPMEIPSNTYISSSDFSRPPHTIAKGMILKNTKRWKAITRAKIPVKILIIFLILFIFRLFFAFVFYPIVIKITKLSFGKTSVPKADVVKSASACRSKYLKPVLKKVHLQMKLISSRLPSSVKILLKYTSLFSHKSLKVGSSTPGFWGIILHETANWWRTQLKLQILLTNL